MFAVAAKTGLQTGRAELAKFWGRTKEFFSALEIGLQIQNNSPIKKFSKSLLNIPGIED